MILRRVLLAFTLAAFIAPCASAASTPKTMATHKPAKLAPKKCVATKKHPCRVGGAAPSHM